METKPRPRLIGVREYTRKDKEGRKGVGEHKDRQTDRKENKRYTGQDKRQNDQR
jgi:hypothetical protein